MSLPQMALVGALVALLTGLVLMQKGTSGQNIQAPCLAPALRDPEKVSRVVVLGDVHGDKDNMVQALQLAGLVDRNESWIGGSDTLVQMGDVVDRGAQSIEAYAFLERLGRDAAMAGGQLISLIGNHEAMMVQGDLRYVERTELKKFGGREPWLEHFKVTAERCKKPEETWNQGCKILWHFQAATVIDRTLLVHAGLQPYWLQSYHLASVEDLNSLVRSSLLQDKRHEVLGYHRGPRGERIPGPLWDRSFQEQPESVFCASLQSTLAAWNLTRMVVGHTPTLRGEWRTRCGGRFILADLGLSRWMYNNVGAMEMLLQREGPLSSTGDSVVFIQFKHLAGREVSSEVLLGGEHCD